MGVPDVSVIFFIHSITCVFPFVRAIMDTFDGFSSLTSEVKLGKLGFVDFFLLEASMAG